MQHDNDNWSRDATSSFKVFFVKGAAPQKWKLDAPGFITGRFHDPDTFMHKDSDSGRFGKWPGIGRDGGGGRRMEVVDGLCVNEK